jgi:hypothetical protein
MKLPRLRIRGRWTNPEVPLKHLPAVLKMHASIWEPVLVGLNSSRFRFLDDALLDLFERGESRELRRKVSMVMESLAFTVQRIRNARNKRNWFRGRWPLAFPMIRWLEKHPDPELRNDVLCSSFIVNDRRAARTLVRVLSNRSEPLQLRQGAAARIAEQLGSSTDRRSRVDKRLVQAAVEGTRDPDPAIRFWSLFALGHVRWSRRGLRAVRRLLSDHTLCPGWWRISEEASDSVARIFGRPIPDRQCVR